MDAKKRIPCFDSELLISEKAPQCYELSIQTNANPLGAGQTLSKYDTEEQAIQAAERFCEVYKIAREKGYYLQGVLLTKPDKEKIPVERLIGSHMTHAQLASHFI
jgi:hypothetical protein